jgi:hypothetical protein
MSASEHEHLLDQRGTVAGGLKCPIDPLPRFTSRTDGGAQRLKRVRDHGQNVVEVMGDSAGQLAQRLHLLRLMQCLSGFLERSCSFLDGAIQSLMRLAKTLLGALAHGNISA